ncbi:50S ribosomal protein L24e [Candidatus Micrarchaeota archaeon]|nr:50S ribosomal protein L24e [Candidatus Micrarchaeota archaeon]
MDCSFCKQEFPRGTGLLFARRDGTILKFCSNSCKKNMLVLKRDPKYQKWITKKVKKKK